MTAVRYRYLLEFLLQNEYFLVLFGLGKDSYAENSEWVLSSLEEETDELFEAYRARGFEPIPQDDRDHYISMDVRFDDFQMISKFRNNSLKAITNNEFTPSSSGVPFVFLALYSFGYGVSATIVGNRDTALNELSKGIRILDENISRESFDYRVEKLYGRLSDCLKRLSK